MQAGRIIFGGRVTADSTRESSSSRPSFPPHEFRCILGQGISENVTWYCGSAPRRGRATWDYLRWDPRGPRGISSRRDDSEESTIDPRVNRPGLSSTFHEKYGSTRSRETCSSLLSLPACDVHISLFLSYSVCVLVCAGARAPKIPGSLSMSCRVLASPIYSYVAYEV